VFLIYVVFKNKSYINNTKDFHKKKPASVVIWSLEIRNLGVSLDIAMAQAWEE